MKWSDTGLSLVSATYSCSQQNTHTHTQKKIWKWKVLGSYWAVEIEMVWD